MTALQNKHIIYIYQQDKKNTPHQGTHVSVKIREAGAGPKIIFG